MICDTVLDAIGHTPLVRLHRMVKPGSAEVLQAQKLGPGKTVVTVLPDTAERYFSTPLFDE